MRHLPSLLQIANLVQYQSLLLSKIVQMWYLLHFCCSLVTLVNPFFRPVYITPEKLWIGRADKSEMCKIALYLGCHGNFWEWKRKQTERLFSFLIIRELIYRFSQGIVIRGDWLWKAANINDKNNSAAVYVGSTLKVHNPLFSVGKLLRNKLMQRFYWSIQSKW